MFLKLLPNIVGKLSPNIFKYRHLSPRGYRALLIIDIEKTPSSVNQAFLSTVLGNSGFNQDFLRIH